MDSLQELTAAAETEWLERWTAGPTEGDGGVLSSKAAAPDLALPDDTGEVRQLSEFWAEDPGLIMFWRHFGCSCGVERAERLIVEHDSYRGVGLNPVIIAQGEPERAAVYREMYDVPCPVMCDPDHVAYRAYGLGHWDVERVLFDAPPEYWTHSHEIGAEFLRTRREQGRPPVDDPWRATAEFVVGSDGFVRLAYAYQYCEDFPDPRVLTTAAQLT